MKICIVLCLFAFVAVALSLPGEKYTDKYDTIDIVEQMIKNDRLFEAYFKCVMNMGKCTEEGREVKSHIREALEDGCAKCTDVQKNETRRMMTYMINEKPVYWNQLIALYDPDKKFVTMYEKELKKIKAN